jgi:folate-binding protein YgfZ
MTPGKIALLADRGVVRVAGGDAEKLLQGLFTNDMGLLAPQRTLFAALLTPQGKILFDFFISLHGGAYLLDTAASHAPQLAKRLEMYRLRSRVDIFDDSAKYRVLAAWDDSGGMGPADPRLAGLGARILLGPGPAAETAAQSGINAAEHDYHAHRIALGVPEGGKDYAFGDIFPHDANLDALNGISFTKGCFVGQEVVSRMQHRSSARKRIVMVEGDAPLEPASEIAAGPSTIGSIGSVSGNRALALVRLDRVDEAAAKGVALTAAGSPVRLRLPDYLKAPAAADAT